MAVDVSPLNVLGGGSPLVNTFSDTFNRSGADLGPTWLSFSCPYTPIASPPNYFQATIPGSNDRVTFGPGGGVNNAAWAPPVFLIPRVVVSTLYGVTQFAQMTWLNLVNTSRCGPCLMADGFGDNRFQLYAISIEPGGTNRISLKRFNGVLTSATLSVDAGNGSLSSGDVVRISADLSVGGQVTLRTSVNGVVKTTIVDNSGSLLNTGCPGMQCNSATTNPTGTADWDSFSCGPGL